MKFEFNCMPNKLMSWAKVQSGCADDTNLDLHAMAEVLFKKIFPEIKSERGVIGDGSWKDTPEEHSVVIYSRHRTITDEQSYRQESFPVLLVQVEGKVEEMATVSQVLKDTGLLDNDSFEQELTDLAQQHFNAVKEHNRRAGKESFQGFAIPLGIAAVVVIAIMIIGLP